MADMAGQTYRRQFGWLVLIDFLTVVVVYALALENAAGGNLVAAALLIGVVCAQTIRCRPSLTLYSWFAMLPIAMVTGVLIGAYPALDWSGPGEPDEIIFAPIYPVIATAFAIGFSLIAGLLFAVYEELRSRPSEASS